MTTVQSTGRPAYKVTRRRVASLKPSPENQHLYDAGEITDLADSIAKQGLHQPLVVTADNVIVSGHRRHRALVCLGRKFVKCHVLLRRRSSWTDDEFLALLRDHNQQRHKTAADQAREALLDLDPDRPGLKLYKQHLNSVYAPESNGLEAIAIEGVQKRYQISADKADHVKYVKKVIFEDRRRYWPLSVRGVHYALLNYEFIRGYWWPQRKFKGLHGTRQTLVYANDQESYSATSDLLTRLRLDGTIPWESLDDFTRPLEQFYPFDNVGEFIHHEADNVFAGYWRNLLQSQPNYIEVVCEKNTIFHMVLEVTKKYQIPTGSGRGYCGIDPWHDLYERFLDSGKERLFVVVVSDYDPEGERIPIVADQTLRDGFALDPAFFEVYKAGVTREQIEHYHLPEQSFAKEDSSLRDWFVERNGGDERVYECEALNPEDLQAEVDGVLRQLIDLDLFNRELEIEREEQARLEELRPRARKALKGLVR
jgi:hypothetical protein